MRFRSFVHVANDLKLKQMELVQLPGKQCRNGAEENQVLDELRLMELDFSHDAVLRKCSSLGITPSIS
jgi:hypothetical protein